MKTKFYKIAVTITEERLKDMLIYADMAAIPLRPFDIMDIAVRNYVNEISVNDAIQAIINKQKNYSLKELLENSDIEIIDEFENNYN